MIYVTSICGSRELFATKLEKLLNENWSIVYIGKTGNGLIEAILQREEVNS